MDFQMRMAEFCKRLTNRATTRISVAATFTLELLHFQNSIYIITLYIRKLCLNVFIQIPCLVLPLTGIKWNGLFERLHLYHPRIYCTSKLHQSAIYELDKCSNFCEERISTGHMAILKTPETRAENLKILKVSPYPPKNGALYQHLPRSQEARDGNASEPKRCSSRLEASGWPISSSVSFDRECDRQAR